MRDLRRGLEVFETLLNRCERLRLRELRFDDLRALGRSYRRYAALLAQMRQRDDDPEAVHHLNALCVRAYAVLYAAPPPAATRRSWSAQLAEALARAWPALALAWLLLGLGMVVGGVLGWRHPEALALFVPADMGYGPDRLDQLVASPAARAEFLRGAVTPATHNVFFGSFLFVHNTRIGLLSLATGMLGGVPTILLQLYNGIVLGAFASIFLHDPWPVPFLAWILPHGIPELTAIALCAAAGLLLGTAVAAPGRRGRPYALRAASGSVLVLFGAALPLFAVAALIESFVRQSALGVEVRLAVAAALASLLIAALVKMRRLSRRFAVDTSWLRELTARGRSATPDSDSARRPSSRPAADPGSANPTGAESPERPRVR